MHRVVEMLHRYRVAFLPWIRGMYDVAITATADARLLYPHVLGARESLRIHRLVVLVLVCGQRMEYSRTVGQQTSGLF